MVTLIYRNGRAGKMIHIIRLSRQWRKMLEKVYSGTYEMQKKIDKTEQEK